MECAVFSVPFSSLRPFDSSALPFPEARRGLTSPLLFQMSGKVAKRPHFHKDTNVFFFFLTT